MGAIESSDFCACGGQTNEKANTNRRVNNQGGGQRIESESYRTSMAPPRRMLHDNSSGNANPYHQSQMDSADMGELLGGTSGQSDTTDGEEDEDGDDHDRRDSATDSFTTSMSGTDSGRKPLVHKKRSSSIHDDPPPPNIPRRKRRSKVNGRKKDHSRSDSDDGGEVIIEQKTDSEDFDFEMATNDIHTNGLRPNGPDGGGGSSRSGSDTEGAGIEISALEAPATLVDPRTGHATGHTATPSVDLAVHAILASGDDSWMSKRRGETDDEYLKRIHQQADEVGLQSRNASLRKMEKTQADTPIHKKKPEDLMRKISTNDGSKFLNGPTLIETPRNENSASSSSNNPRELEISPMHGVAPRMDKEKPIEDDDEPSIELASPVLNLGRNWKESIAIQKREEERLKEKLSQKRQQTSQNHRKPSFENDPSNSPSQSDSRSHSSRHKPQRTHKSSSHHQKKSPEPPPSVEIEPSLSQSEKGRHHAHHQPAQSSWDRKKRKKLPDQSIGPVIPSSSTKQKTPSPHERAQRLGTRERGRSKDSSTHNRAKSMRERENDRAYKKRRHERLGTLHRFAQASNSRDSGRTDSPIIAGGGGLSNHRSNPSLANGHSGGSGLAGDRSPPLSLSPGSSGGSAFKSNPGRGTLFKEGWLEKKGGGLRGSWNKRWCVISGAWFGWAKDRIGQINDIDDDKERKKKFAKCLRITDLAEIVSDDFSTNEKRKREFSVLSDDRSKRYSFRAVNPMVKDSWVSILNQIAYN